ncbi:head decoration protein [Actinomycetospora termitidis]|uniref:Head decoration protein n=1 Tax=Actinomycetospora termitidis TaxID=3053470 RepID=A0ABT7MFG7_9PSEU|nr:head decoration protein [Actinomycetospora sp. Odt1-22]MDL5159412.1 head decoration protein [Actinomycetospora sp. Odt1-22]
MAQYNSGGGYTPGYRHDPIDLGYQVDFLASERYTVKQGGITIDPATVSANSDGKKVVKGGTVMGKITATGKYGPYASGASDGRQAAVGVLFAGDIRVDGGDTVAGLMIQGSVKEARLTGLDATAKTALTPRFIFQ